MCGNGIKMVQFHVFWLLFLVFVQHFSRVSCIPAWHCRERIIVCSFLSTWCVKLCVLWPGVVYWRRRCRLIALVRGGLKMVLRWVLIFGLSRTAAAWRWAAGVTAGEAGTTAFGAAAEAACDTENHRCHDQGGDYYCCYDGPSGQRSVSRCILWHRLVSED